MMSGASAQRASHHASCCFPALKRTSAHSETVWFLNTSVSFNFLLFDAEILQEEGALAAPRFSQASRYVTWTVAQMVLCCCFFCQPPIAKHIPLGAGLLQYTIAKLNPWHGSFQCQHRSECQNAEAQSKRTKLTNTKNSPRTQSNNTGKKNHSNKENRMPDKTKTLKSNAGQFKHTQQHAEETQTFQKGQIKTPKQACFVKGEAVANGT